MESNCTVNGSVLINGSISMITTCLPVSCELRSEMSGIRGISINTSTEEILECDNGCYISDKYCDNVEDCPDASCNNITCASINNFDACSQGIECLYGDTSIECPQYKCKISDFNLTMELWLLENPDVNLTMDQINSDQYLLTWREAKNIVKIAGYTGTIGLNLQDPMILISLLLINWICAMFIIIGLYKYERTKRFRNININYVVFLIIILQNILFVSTETFSQPIIQCTTYGMFGVVNSLRAPSPLSIVQYIFAILLWYQWCQQSCTGKYSSSCKYFIVIVIILFLLLHLLISDNYAYDDNVSYLFGLIFLAYYWSFQLLIPVIWIVMAIKGFFACKYRPKWNFCTSLKFWGFMYLIIMCGCQVVCFSFIAGFEGYFTCDWYSTISLMNPMFIICHICLLFSKARYTASLYLIILTILALCGLVTPLFCYFVINVQYIIHALFIPIYIILIFATFEELKEWKFGLISMYLVALDIFTDIIVVFYFIGSQDYQFAALQILFVILGQIFSSFSDNLTDFSEKLTITDKIISIFGFSRPWFLIKSWSESEDRYFKLYNKHKIWELMFESFPTISLQIYAALMTKGNPATLVASICFSLLAVTYGVWIYLVGLAHQDVAIEHRHAYELKVQNDHELKETEEDEPELEEEKHGFVYMPKMPSVINRKFGKVIENKRIYFNLYGYMISDFCIRSFPIIIFIACIPCYSFEYGTICVHRTVIFLLLLCGLLLFEFIMNLKMREKQYRSIRFVMQIFPISVLSSFYTILSSLDILQNDPFFGKSIIFKTYFVEHKLRIILSIFMNVVNFVLILVFKNNDDNWITKLILTLFCGIMLIVNVLTIKRIDRYIQET